jgi:hypothetical protein
MDLHLDPCQQFTDAVSRACGKRQHRQRVPILRVIWTEPVRIEPIRSLPETGMPLDEVRRNVNFPAGTKYSPSRSFLRALRDISQTAGYKRSASSTTWRV